METKIKREWDRNAFEKESAEFDLETKIVSYLILGPSGQGSADEQSLVEYFAFGSKHNVPSELDSEVRRQIKAMPQSWKLQFEAEINDTKTKQAEADKKLQDEKKSDLLNAAVRDKALSSLTGVGYSFFDIRRMARKLFLKPGGGLYLNKKNANWMVLVPFLTLFFFLIYSAFTSLQTSCKEINFYNTSAPVEGLGTITESLVKVDHRPSSDKIRTPYQDVQLHIEIKTKDSTSDQPGTLTISKKFFGRSALKDANTALDSLPKKGADITFYYLPGQSKIGPALIKDDLKPSFGETFIVMSYLAALFLVTFVVSSLLSAVLLRKSTQPGIYALSAAVALIISGLPFWLN